MTPAQIKGIFAFAILQNKTKLISNLNANNYPTSLNVSNQDLVDKMYSIYIEKGFNEISRLFEGIKITEASMPDAIALQNSFLTGAPSSRKTFLETLQELWAGAKDVIGGSEETTSKPVVSPVIAGIVLIVFVSLIGVILWKA